MSAGEAAHSRPTGTTTATVRRALVASALPATIELAQRVLTILGYRVTTVDGQGPWPVGGMSLALIGSSRLDIALGGGLPPAGTAGPRVIVCNEETDARTTMRQICERRLSYVIGGGAHADEALFTTLAKLDADSPFGLERYLLPGAVVHRQRVLASEKARALGEVRHLAHQARCHPIVTDLLIAAADEMLINALYLPETALGPVELDCACDSRVLAIAVRDHAGRMNADALHRGLLRGLEHAQRGVPGDAASANLGFRVMLGTLSQLAINVQPGRRTEVIGLVDLRRALKEYRSAAPSLGVYFQP